MALCNAMKLVRSESVETVVQVLAISAMACGAVAASHSTTGEREVTKNKEFRCMADSSLFRPAKLIPERTHGVRMGDDLRKYTVGVVDDLQHRSRKSSLTYCVFRVRGAIWNYWHLGFLWEMGGSDPLVGRGALGVRAMVGEVSIRPSLSPGRGRHANLGSRLHLPPRCWRPSRRSPRRRKK